MNPYCQNCPAGTKCSRHGIVKTHREVHLCSLTADTPDRGLKYWLAWERGELGATAPAEPVLDLLVRSVEPNRPARKSRGLGDRFAAGIEKITGGRLKKKGCSGCSRRAAMLNHYFPAKVAPLAPLPFTGEVRRNLIYHIYPRRGDIWQWNVQQLRQRMDLFNGRRVVAVVTDRRTDSADDVKAAFGDTVAEWIVDRNVPKLGETLTYPRLLSAVMDDDPNAVTFYAHAKGVSRKESEWPIVQHWAQRMYQCCLDDWPLVEAMLVGHGVAGAYRRHQRLGSASWYYSGTFFWFRHTHVAGRNWEYIDRKRYWGVESWPGHLFRLNEAGVLCADQVGSLYTKREWERIENEACQNEQQRRNLEAAGSGTRLSVSAGSVGSAAAGTARVAGDREAPEITLITPTGDRPVSFGLLERWIQRQSYDRPYQWIVVDDGVVPTRVTAGQQYVRVTPRRGDPAHTLARNLRVALPHVRGHKVLIVEDDDWYAPEHLATMARWLDADAMAAAGYARYYWPRHARYREFPDHRHASLCRTGIRRELLQALAAACATSDPSVDLRLWAAVGGRRHDDAVSVVSMKGMPGRKSGGGDPRAGTSDADLSRLRAWIGDDLEHYRPILPKAVDCDRAIRERIVVYTVVLAGYDAIHRPLVANPDVRYVALTEGMAPPPWETVRVGASAHPKRESRRLKILGPERWPDADWTIYVDGQLQLAVDPLALIAECEAWGGDADLYVFRHQDRQCIYAEAQAVIRIGRAPAADVTPQINRYRAAGVPTDLGLYLGGMLIRRPGAESFNRVWWREVERGSHRDQISLPVALAETGIRYGVLPVDWWQHFFLRHPHRPAATRGHGRAIRKRSARCRSCR